MRTKYYQYTVVPCGNEYAVRADHRQGQLVAFRETEEAAQRIARHLQDRALSRFR